MNDSLILGVAICVTKRYKFADNHISFLDRQGHINRRDTFWTDIQPL